MSATDGTSLSTPGGDSLDIGERAELERLRAEVTELRAQPAGGGPLAGQPTGRRRRRIGWRTPVATLLIVIACLLAPLSVVSVWTANQVSDTSRYVANMTPLVHDPAIQNALTDKITAADHHPPERHQLCRRRGGAIVEQRPEPGRDRAEQLRAVNRQRG